MEDEFTEDYTTAGNEQNNWAWHCSAPASFFFCDMYYIFVTHPAKQINQGASPNWLHLQVYQIIAAAP